MQISRIGLAIGTLALICGSIVMGLLSDKGGFYEVRLFELVSFVGTTVIGGLIAYHLSGLLTKATGVQQVKLEALSQLDEALKELYQEWQQHQHSPTHDRFQNINTKLKSIGLEVSALEESGKFDDEPLGTLWIRVRRGLTGDGYREDSPCSPAEQRRGEQTVREFRSSITQMKIRIFDQ
jgi:hypothetical protein